MMTVVVVVIDESKDSLIKRHAVFLRLDVNVVIFYRSPKSFYPDVVLCQAESIARESGPSPHPGEAAGVGETLVPVLSASVFWEGSKNLIIFVGKRSSV